MTMLTAQSPEYYGVTRVVGPDGGPVAVAHAAFKSSILFTRPNNATAYTAGDVIGRADTVTPANAGDAIIRLAGVGPVGGALSLETVELHFDTNAIPAGMTTFRLHLYGLPPTPVLDNAVYNLSSAEIARYLGFITLNAPVDLGDTIYSITTDIRRHINLVPYSGSLYAELETVGAFTPAALTPVTLKVSSRQLSPATQLVEDLPIAGSFPALPTLNLKFSENRNLIDDVSGRQLITFTRASSATFIDSAGTLQTAAVDVPRFDHNPTTGESLGLLVEEQRTNLLLNTATLSTQSVTVTAVAHTLSFYGSGTVTLSGASTAGPAVGSGAFPARTTLTFTPSAGTLTLTVTGSVTSAQLEAGAFPTSYIPTTTAAATRSADVCSITGANFSSWYRQDEGTVFAEASTYLGTAAVSRALWSIESDANNVHRFLRQSDQQPVSQTIAGGVSQVTFGFGANWNTAANRKLSYAYAVNNFASTVDNLAIQTDTSGSLPSPTTLNIGNTSGFSPFGGTIRRLTYWPQRLSNSTLQTITQ